MAYKLFMLLLAVAMASSALSVHPRFRPWLPPYRYHPAAHKSPNVVYSTHLRPPDRPVMTWFRGKAARGANNLLLLPAGVTSSVQASQRSLRLQRIRRIRDMLETLAKVVKQFEIHTNDA